MTEDEFRQIYKTRTPLQRVCSPEELVRVASSQSYPPVLVVFHHTTGPFQCLNSWNCDVFTLHCMQLMCQRIYAQACHGSILVTPVIPPHMSCLAQGCSRVWLHTVSTHKLHGNALNHSGEVPRPPPPRSSLTPCACLLACRRQQ